jgi:branched-chain amino acid transport system permease protein
LVFIALLIITIIGGLSYILLIKPLQDSQVGVVLVTFGLAFLIEQVVMVISGTEAWTMTELQLVQGTTVFLGYTMINQYILLIIISVITVSLFALFISKSKLGKSIRAVSQDREAASLMGINANRVLLYTVMISALLAGIAAFLYLPGAAISGPSMGWTFLTNSFSVVILGGMGSLVGSVVGAFIIGYSISFTQVFVSIQLSPTISIQGPSWAHLIPIIIIVVVLLIRPRGLFGKQEME